MQSDVYVSVYGIKNNDDETSETFIDAIPLHTDNWQESVQALIEGNSNCYTDFLIEDCMGKRYEPCDLNKMVFH